MQEKAEILAEISVPVLCLIKIPRMYLYIRFRVCMIVQYSPQVYGDSYHPF
jgi:hypothetical protein